MKPTFFATLESSITRAESLLCVGLDPSLEIPAAEVLPRARAVVDATLPYACVYKPNAAFFEARGVEGWEILAAVIRHIHERGAPVILDAKRGDISSSADGYAKACFDLLGADAITLNPLLGADSIESFARREEKGAFVLCHTSNPGARDLQELEVHGVPLFETIAARVREWNTRGNLGLVVGATYPGMLARVRAIAPKMWVLLPGVGTQGGDLEASLKAGLDETGSGLVVNVSRAIWQAGDPAAAAREYRHRIEEVRRQPKSGHGGKGQSGPGSLPDEIALGLHSLGAVRFGQFTLKSGKSSPIYIDLRLLVSDPALMSLAARALAGIMAGLRFDRIAAIPYGGLPIGQAVALATGKPLIYPRREAKDYGTKKLIEGAFSAGETAVVLDDLVTTGGSKIEAMEPLTEAGLKITDVVVLVDREQGGAKELSERGLALHAVLSLSDLLDVLVRHGRIDEKTRGEVRSALGIG